MFKSRFAPLIIGVILLAVAAAGFSFVKSQKAAQSEAKAERRADIKAHQLGADAVRELAETKMATASPAWLPDPLGRMTWTYSAPVVVQGRSGTLKAVVLRDADGRTGCKMNSRVHLTYSAPEYTQYDEGQIGVTLCHPAFAAFR